MSHHYESKCIDINKQVDVSGTDEGRAPTRNMRTIESYIGGSDEKEAMFEKYDLKAGMAMKLAHLKEAVASHEETQRLQRMCRHLKVGFLFSNLKNSSNFFYPSEQTIPVTSP